MRACVIFTLLFSLITIYHSLTLPSEEKSAAASEVFSLDVERKVRVRRNSETKKQNSKKQKGKNKLKKEKGRKSRRKGKGNRTGEARKPMKEKKGNRKIKVGENPRKGDKGKIGKGRKSVTKKKEKNKNSENKKGKGKGRKGRKSVMGQKKKNKNSKTKTGKGKARKGRKSETEQKSRNKKSKRKKVAGKTGRKSRITNEKKKGRRGKKAKKRKGNKTGKVKETMKEKKGNKKVKRKGESRKRNRGKARKGGKSVTEQKSKNKKSKNKNNKKVAMKKGRKSSTTKEKKKAKKTKKARKAMKKMGNKSRKVKKTMKEKKKRKENKRKKGKKSRKGKNSFSRGDKKFQTRSSNKTVFAICFKHSIHIMKMWKDVVHNFHKQNMRMKRQNTTGGNKFGKKDAFLSTAKKLLFTGGNNKLNLSCDGSTTNKGAVQLKNLTDTLSSCATDITTVCKTSSWPQPDMTKVSQCDTLASQFNKGAEACLTKTIKEANATSACACWTESNLNKTVQDVKKCKFSTEAEKIKKALKKCTASFSKCRKYEDAAITVISACKLGYADLTKKVRRIGLNIICYHPVLFQP